MPERRLDHLAAYRVTRPTRGLVLVALPDGVPWQAAMLCALRGQAATWGGSANLVVPWTEDLLKRPLFWAIAALLDPDAVLMTTLAESDLHGLVEGAQAPTGGLAGRTEMPLGRPDGRPVLAEMGRRLPLLQRDGSPRPHNVSPKGASWPWVPTYALSGLPETVQAARCPASLDLALMAGAERGDLSDDAVELLAARGCQVTISELSSDEALDLALEGPPIGAAPGAWALGELGLRWLVPTAALDRTPVVVVGDDPWDFALAYALRRLTSLAWWFPGSLADDELVAARLARRVRDLADAEAATVTSVSDGPAALRLSLALGRAVGSASTTWTACAPLQTLEVVPGRLLTGPGGLESLALQDGLTGYLPPQLPGVRAHGDRGLSWMSELVTVNWQPLPDARLAEQVVRAPTYGGAVVRTTREGAAYLCPHFVRFRGEDLAASTVRPRIATPRLHEQLSAIAQQQGWSITPSDKGLYAQASAALLGGDRPLLDALADTRWTGWFAQMREGDGHGWKLKDDRVYLSAEELSASLAAHEVPASAEQLLERGVLLRGLVFRCPRCQLKAWYGADELAERLRCARCRRPFTLTEPGWQPTVEPQWRYRLAEVLWQLLQHNGDLPLRALRTVLRLGTQDGPTEDWLNEHDLWAPGAERPLELDICAQRGAELWIGEAKIADTLGTRQAEVAKLSSLRTAAELLRPHGILLVTAQPEWNVRTAQSARQALGDVPVQLLLASSPPPGQTLWASG